MSTIEELYVQRNRPEVDHPDIWEHMGTLRRYAEKVTTICEIGMRTGNSTVAFLAGLIRKPINSVVIIPAMRSYDIADQKFFPPDLPNVSWKFIQADSQADDFKIPRCELLFIDGDHKYESVKKDLRQAERVWRYIILHDTSPQRDATYGDGVCRAMDEFLASNPEWTILERFANCNGLTILGRA